MAGFLGGSTPQPTTVALDPQTQAIESQEAQKAGQPSSEWTGRLNANMDQSGALGQSDQQTQHLSQQTGMSPGQIGAIRNVYGMHAREGIQRLKGQNDLQGQMMKADYMSKMSQAMLGQQVTAVNQYQVLTNAYQQQEMARAGLVNSLFQTADVGIGMKAAQNRAAGNAALQSQNNPPVIGSSNVGGGDPYGGADYTPSGTYNMSPEMTP